MPPRVFVVDTIVLPSLTQRLGICVRSHRRQIQILRLEGFTTHFASLLGDIEIYNLFGWRSHGISSWSSYEYVWYIIKGEYQSRFSCIFMLVVFSCLIFLFFPSLFMYFHVFL